MTPSEIGEVLAAIGCPTHKVTEMAAQLEKRARQLASERGGTVEHALGHLLSLMSQGWAAQSRQSLASDSTNQPPTSA